MSAQAFLSSVQEAQQTGTLEVLMTTSTAPAELVILSSISAFAGNLVNLLVYLLAGVAVFRASIHANFFSCVAVLVLSLAIALALGIVAATLQVCVPERLGLVVVARLRALVSERNHVPDPDLAAPAGTDRACYPAYICRRWNAQGVAGGSVDDDHGSDSRRPGLLCRDSAAACPSWPFAESAARTTEWNSLVLLKCCCNRCVVSVVITEPTPGEQFLRSNRRRWCASRRRASRRAARSPAIALHSVSPATILTEVEAGDAPFAGRVRRPSSAVLGFECGLPRAKRRTMDCQSMSWLSMGSSALPSARLRLYSSPFFPPTAVSVVPHL